METNTNILLKLISDLFSKSESPTKRLLLLYESFDKMNNLTNEHLILKQEIVDIFKNNILKKKNQWKTPNIKNNIIINSSSNNNNSFIKNNYSIPKFFKNSKAKGNCKVCNFTFIDNESNLFLHRQNKQITLYCCVPSCFPNSFKLEMENDKDYLNWKNSTNQKLSDI